jgi:DNA-binding IscR family transcriptional regulator
MINRRTDYGLRCLLYLAQQSAERWVPTAEVSKRMRVSPVFLAKIFQPLAEAGVAAWQERGHTSGKKRCQPGVFVAAARAEVRFQQVLVGRLPLFSPVRLPTAYIII